jgi:uncharacterized protein involved in exopolysaccharide biosynthesis
MADEPDNLTLRILREIRESMATKDDISSVTSQIASVNDRIDGLGRTVAADLHDLARKDDQLAAQLTSLREAVMHYHSSVLGHGVIISELEARVRRLEQHLHISPDN